MAKPAAVRSTRYRRSRVSGPPLHSAVCLGDSRHVSSGNETRGDLRAAELVATDPSSALEAPAQDTFPGEPIRTPRDGRLGLPVGTVLEGVYEVKGLLGAGAMGMVYLVEHVGLGKEFALKMVDGTKGLDAQAIARLRNEARVASAVDHENVVSLTHIGQATDRNVFIVMERLRGEDLADRLARQRAAAEPGAPAWLPDAEVVTIVDGVLERIWQYRLF